MLLQITDLHTRTLRLLTDAEQSGQRIVALRAVNEARANLTLMLELVGEPQRAQNIAVAVEVNAAASGPLDEVRVRQAGLDFLAAGLPGDLKARVVDWVAQQHHQHRATKLARGECTMRALMPSSDQDLA